MGELPDCSKSAIDNIYCNMFTGGYSTNTIRIAQKQIYIFDSSNLAIEDFKQKLSQTNLIFYYELETPIITPIDPIEFDIKPLSSVVINSDIVPESIHTVQLNRAAQIERGIIEIAELKKRVNTLEATYNSYFLENYHKLNLLNLEYEMERMIE